MITHTQIRARFITIGKILMQTWTKIHDLYTSRNIHMIKSRIRWEVVHVAHMGDRKYVYCLLVGRLGGMKPLGRSWHRWEYNGKMDLQEVEWGDMDWTNLIQEGDRWLALAYVVKNMMVSPIDGNFTS